MGCVPKCGIEMVEVMDSDLHDQMRHQFSEHLPGMDVAHLGRKNGEEGQCAMTQVSRRGGRFLSTS
jgi:uncharacterized lipoprotein YmbA